MDRVQTNLSIAPCRSETPLPPIRCSEQIPEGKASNTSVEDEMSISNDAREGVFIGVDVGKYDLEAYQDGQSSTQRFSNSTEGFDRLLSGFPDHVAWIIIEATGGYEKNLQLYLQQAGYRVHVAHPVRVRAFATAHGIAAKTDPIDARVLAQYGRAMESLTAAANVEEITQLQSLNRRRRQLVEARDAERSRIDKIVSPQALDSIERHLRWFTEEIHHIESEIDTLLEDHQELKSQVLLYESVKGIGRQTAVTLLTDLPELGDLEGKSITALVGLAPYARDSSTLKRHRKVRGGRIRVRNALYMAALVSTRHNPDLKQFYERLRAKGKPGKVALTAVMRKLLLILNAIAKRQTPWQPSSAPCQA